MISRQILLVEYELSVEKIVDTYNIYLYLFNDNYPRFIFVCFKNSIYQDTIYLHI